MEVDLEHEYIHLHKTGAAAGTVLSGALIAGADEALLEALRTYSRAIGGPDHDDILDVTASSEVLGKTKEDLTADKTTYPKLLGLEESKARAEARCRRLQRVETLERRPSRWALAGYITSRDR